MFAAGTVKVVKGEGFPHYRNPFEKGDMLIKFDVEFPEQNFANESQLKVCAVHFKWWDLAFHFKWYSFRRSLCFTFI